MKHFENYLVMRGPQFCTKFSTKNILRNSKPMNLNPYREDHWKRRDEYVGYLEWYFVLEITISIDQSFYSEP